MTTHLSDEIGGYFGLEIAPKYDNIKDAIALNSARNCLRYVIRAYNIKEIYLPFYTCPVVLQAIRQENCNINFYNIDENFLPMQEFDKEAYILYTNYFGICTNNVKQLAEKYENLIIDNAQSFYSKQYGIASFNSIRKFFGVSDGALLCTNKKLNETFETDTSYQRFSHLLKRIDINASFGYENFCANDDSLINEPIKIISNLTKTILNSININEAKDKRLENFNKLNDDLSQINELKIELNKDDVPMVYPLLVKKTGLRENLIKNKIYVAQYWQTLQSGYNENIFQQYLLPLPIDQRYGEKEMTRIIEVLYA